MSKQKNIRLVSPKGRAIWPRLNAPDTKFNADGEFTARLGMDSDADETVAFIKRLEGIRDEAFAKFVSENPKKKKATMARFYREETDDEGEETGEISFNFKMKHKIKTKDGKTFTKIPVLLSAKKEILKNPPNIGSGSVLKASFEAVPYFNEKDKEFGLSLRLVAVQIINLVEFGGASMAANDFDEEDGDDIVDGGASADDDDDDDSDDSDDSDDDDY